ncbi:hypothetical protein XENOCAPTIV_023450 [Xenoophorus captivus]|uniref:Uncharacterized protein n=1 Tax=Xenoophorus captivus TaxID=1517983 RepID=A0ABV0RD99_9TELE
MLVFICFALCVFRYKSLCPETWPNWNGKLSDGVSTLVKHLGYKPEEYKLGRFIKGFIYRHKERCPENEYFLDYVRYSFLMNLRKNLPKNVLDKNWPAPPAALVEASELLRKMCMQNMVWSYCKKISSEWKHQLLQYADVHSFYAQYAVPVTKYDRKGYKPRSRQLLLTANSAIIVEEGKLKQRIDYAALKGPRLINR